MKLGKTIRRRALVPVLALFITLTAALPAAIAEEEVVSDTWSVMRMAGDEVGWVYEKIFKLTENGVVQYRTETASKMELKRFGQKIEIAVEGWSLEDDTGHVLEMEQTSLMSGTETHYGVKVDGEKALLTVTTMGNARTSTIDWDKEVLGPMGIWYLRNEKGMAPGTKYSYKVFLFDYTKVVVSTVTVKGEEETELLDGKKDTLLHAVSTIDIMPGVKTHEYWNDTAHTLKTFTSMMGITIETFQTSKERAALAEGGELKADMILATMARSNVNLPNPYRLDSILYSFTAKDSEIGLPDELDDIRQKVLATDGETAKVMIHARVPESSQKRPMTDPPAELEEYLAPNAFLQCDDAALAAKAHEVVGNETDAWKAAQKLEHFVFKHITAKNFGTGFASASEVFENRTGDCSEHGVLLAAACRAVGIPARVAMGYMYLGGIFGGHMWTEVWIDGDWYPIDGVMGIGRVDPTHITFCTSSLKDGGIGEAFVKAVQGLGNIEINILEFTRGKKTVKVGEEFKDYVIEGNRYTNTLYGISLVKPDGYEFDDYVRDFSGVDFDLVDLECKGRPQVEVQALPASFSFSIDEFRKQIQASGVEINSETPRKICGRPGVVISGDSDNETGLLLAVIDQDTLFIIKMEIKEEERDIEVFEEIIDSITLPGGELSREKVEKLKAIGYGRKK